MDEVKALRKTMSQLRAPDGCPWDREQTHQTLSQHLIEECCELLEAIDRDDTEHMVEELGDVLLQVVFHAQMAQEAGTFDLDDVARGINEKLIRRHPHVFGDLSLHTAEDVLSKWDDFKAAEKKNGVVTTALKPLPPRLPALLFARDVIKQVRKRGYQAATVPPEDDANKALTEEALGAQLFQLVVAARDAGLDPEAALRRHTQGVIDAVEDAHG